MAEISQSTTAAAEWAKGWPIVLSSLIGIALCLSPLPYWALIIIGPELGKEFGWSRETIQAGFLAMTVGVLFGAPIAGKLTDKYGARRVLLPSIILLGLGTACFALMNPSPLSLYGIFFLLALFSSGTLPITWSKAIVNNFNSSRGLALGIALTGTGLYGFIAPPLIQGLIDGFGWRVAYLGIAAMPLLISFPLAYFLFRDDKEEAALASKTDDVELPGLSFSQSVRDYRFWIILFAFLIIGAAVSGIIANGFNILLDKGYTPQDAASRTIGIGVIGLSVIVGRLVGGFLVDRIWAPLVAFIFITIPILGCFILMGNMSVGLNVFAFILVGIAAGVELDMMAFLVSRYLGMKAYGRIYGFVYAAFGLGSGTAPLLFNILKGETLDYNNALMFAMAGFLVGAVMLLFLGKYRDFGETTH